MKSSRLSLLSALFAALLALGLTGCKEEGALEKAGKEADKALEKTADAAENAADKVREAVK